MSENRAQEKTKKKIKLEKSGPMKKLEKGNLSTSSLKESEHFFIKPSEKLNVKKLRSNESSPLISSNPSTTEEKLSTVLSSPKIVSKKENIKKTQEGSSDSINKKKPFDKKLFRLKKYSKKYKLQQWEEKRKKTLLREYQRSYKNMDEPKLNVAKIYEDDTILNESKTKQDEDNENDSFDTENLHKKKKEKKRFLKPHERYQQLVEEKQKKMEENIRRKTERQETIRKAKKERFEKNKKLSQKTKKGQPIMKYRIEMLLEKIEKSLQN